jgi:periplasmic divalent cation tolerance protein
MEYRFIYMTTENRDQAREIGRVLVRERLAACVNIIDGMNSMYWWEGKVQDDDETVLIAKTKAALVPELTERVKKLHSYDWIGRETR